MNIICDIIDAISSSRLLILVIGVYECNILRSNNKVQSGILEVGV